MSPQPARGIDTRHPASLLLLGVLLLLVAGPPRPPVSVSPARVLLLPAARLPGEVGVHVVLRGVRHAGQDLRHRDVLGALHQAAAEQRLPDEHEEALAHAVDEVQDAHQDGPEEHRQRHHDLLHRHPAHAAVLPPQIAEGEDGEEAQHAVDEVGEGRARLGRRPPR